MSQQGHGGKGKAWDKTPNGEGLDPILNVFRPEPLSEMMCAAGSANVKLASVVTDILGVSGRLRVDRSAHDPGVLADLAFAGKPQLLEAPPSH
jgi:hypothetical protein